MQLTGIEGDVRKRQNPEHKKVESENGIDQVLRQELEEEKE
jgi:hypothetical protein